VKVSIVLPTYNESSNIVDLVEQIIKQTPSPWELEIIVVDDNSPDGTFDTIKDAYAQDQRIIAFLRKEDPGLAKSIRAGIEKATGEQVLVMDTDFTHDPVEIPKMLHLGKMYDVVSGSRFCAGGSMEDQPHYLASLFYNWFIRIILRTQIQDNLGGFFTISRKKLCLLPYDDIFFGYGDYFFRLLNYSQKKRYTVIEIPTHYCTRSKGTSKSNFHRLLCSYSKAIFKFRLKLFLEKKSYKTIDS